MAAYFNVSETDFDRITAEAEKNGFDWFVDMGEDKEGNPAEVLVVEDEEVEF